MATKKTAGSLKEEMSKRRQQLRDEHAVAVREKIQTTNLVDVLQGFALGKTKVKMTAARLKAIEMLLDKSVPDLASIKHEVERKQVVFLIDTGMTDDTQAAGE